MLEEGDLKSNPEYGPYLGAALFCEKVLQEKDGVNSAIRIIDRVTHTFIPQDPSQQFMPFSYQVSLLLILKTGENPGLTKVKVIPTKPTNEKLPEWKQSINLERPSNRGATINMNMTITFDQPGVWWFEILVNGISRTKIPLEVIALPRAK